MLVPLDQLLEDLLGNRKSTNIKITDEKDITIQHTDIKIGQNIMNLFEAI